MIHSYNISTGYYVRYCVCTGPATDLAFAQSNNKLLVSVGQDRNIRFLDVHQRKWVSSRHFSSNIIVSVITLYIRTNCCGLPGKWCWCLRRLLLALWLFSEMVTLLLLEESMVSSTACTHRDGCEGREEGEYGVREREREVEFTQR